MIRVDRLTYVYMAGTPYEKKALDACSLEIAQNDFVGLIGCTGSGKSTLVQHFNGLIKAPPGTVFIDGRDITSQDMKALRQKVGLVFQYPEHQLFEETVYKDIAFGLVRQGLPEEEIRTRVMAALRAVNLDEPGIPDKSPFELSGGQKRRAAIAGIIVMQPEVLVLDEPAAGLDPKGREEIYRMVGALHREGRVTVVLVSHNMEDIAHYARRILVMHEGRIIMEGPAAEVFSRREELTAIGLDVPSITRVMDGLKKEFPGLNTVLTVEEAKDEILRYLGMNPWKEGSRFR